MNDSLHYANITLCEYTVQSKTVAVEIAVPLLLDDYEREHRKLN